MAVVTVSAAYGTGGSEIAPAVARRLDARFVDRAIPVHVAERLAVRVEEAVAHDETAGSALVRFLSGLAAAGGVYGTGPLEPIAAGPERFQQETECLIREAAESGDAVILGRAAALVLREYPGVLHVRLDGPPAARAALAARRQGIEVAEAERHLRETDRAREAYVRHFYRVDARDPSLYHLVVDATALSAEACVEVICAAAAGVA